MMEIKLRAIFFLVTVNNRKEFYRNCLRIFKIRGTQRTLFLYRNNRKYDGNIPTSILANKLIK